MSHYHFPKAFDKIPVSVVFQKGINRAHLFVTDIEPFRGNNVNDMTDGRKYFD